VGVGGQPKGVPCATFGGKKDRAPLATQKNRAINEAKLKTEAGQKSCLEHFPKIIS